MLRILRRVSTATTTAGRVKVGRARQQLERVLGIINGQALLCALHEVGHGPLAGAVVLIVFLTRGQASLFLLRVAL